MAESSTSAQLRDGERGALLLDSGPVVGKEKDPPRYKKQAGMKHFLLNISMVTVVHEYGPIHSTNASGRPQEEPLFICKEYSKITGTIASVRRNRQLSDDIYEDANVRVHSSQGNRGNSHEPSFIAETSFVRAPSNSRVGDQAMNKRWEFLKKSESNFNHL
ncbi:hypothetical protein BDR03DRAFT_1003681 [Suillus americanus]|nr:hypothetical protein BDR03DRAFT_1003681 [Suillus americanus]